MKWILTCLMAFCCNLLLAQDRLPSISLKTLQGTEINTSTLVDSTGPIVISFWATWCKPCMQELDAFNEAAAEWKKQTGARIIAIAIDDSRTVGNVKAAVNMHDWEFQVLTDENQDLKRALNISNIPHTIILNKKGEIVQRYTAYIPGNEKKILELLRTL